MLFRLYMENQRKPGGYGLSGGAHSSRLQEGGTLGRGLESLGQEATVKVLRGSRGDAAVGKAGCPTG